MLEGGISNTFASQTAFVGLSCKRKQFLETGRHQTIHNSQIFSSQKINLLLSEFEPLSFTFDIFTIYVAGTLLCHDNGTWSGSLPKCLPHTCDTVSCDEDQFCNVVDNVPVCQLGNFYLIHLAQNLKVASTGFNHVIIMCRYALKNSYN